MWPHDTAIAVRGLARDGYVDEAAPWPPGRRGERGPPTVRLPELYGGDQSTDVAFPVDYPASCRPQAWAAAAPLACLVAVTGLDVDAAAGRVDVPATASTRLGPFTLRGVRVGGRELAVRVDERGHVDVLPGVPPTP